MRKPDLALLEKASNILQKTFGTDIHIRHADYLSELERRNVILRLFLSHKSLQAPKTVILKQSLTLAKERAQEKAFARFARDWAALKFLSNLPQNMHTVPTFYGGDTALNFILIEDLGAKHISLVDSLTSSDEKAAIEALSRFTKALGYFHASGFDSIDKYQRILFRITQKQHQWESHLIENKQELFESLEIAKHFCCFTVSSALIEEIENVISTLFDPGPFTTLIHGDICPDNVFDHNDTKDLQLIDFEWSFIGNALLDGTYLRMGMPTCWCTKRIPEDIVNAMEIIYRDELKKKIPAACDDEVYYESYTFACAFWMLRSLHWLEKVWEKDMIGPTGAIPENSLWDPSKNTVRPRVIYRLETFIKIAAKYDKLPNVRQMAVTILNTIQHKWQNVEPFALYPAFC